MLELNNVVLYLQLNIYLLPSELLFDLSITPSLLYLIKLTILDDSNSLTLTLPWSV